MKHLLLTTIAAVVLVGTAFADPIHNASRDGDLASVQAELDKGVDVNAMDESDVTPLHQAASYGHKEIAELLIAEGADVNAKIKKKYYFKKNQTTLYINTPTPLDWANINKQTEIADLLRKHGGKKGEVFKAEDK